MEIPDQEVWLCESSNCPPKVSSILLFFHLKSLSGHAFSDLVMLDCPCSIPTIVSGDAAIYSTDIYQKEPSGNIQKLVFSKVDAAELDTLFVRGNKVDAFFPLEIYGYQQDAGIRLVAKRLVVHSK